jgi:predicted XRE-type DNA-binding protein
MNVNIYEELGYPNAEEQFLKAKLVSHVGDIIRGKELTQAQVAEITGLTQPQISNILRGRFRDVSVEKLMRIATSLHHSIHIVIDPDPSESAAIYVELAAHAEPAALTA